MTPLYAGKTTLKLGIFPRNPAPAAEEVVLHRQEWLEPQVGFT